MILKDAHRLAGDSGNGMLAASSTFSRVLLMDFLDFLTTSLTAALASLTGEPSSEVLLLDQSWLLPVSHPGLTYALFLPYNPLNCGVLDSLVSLVSR